MPLRHSAMLEVNEFLVLDYVRERQRTSRPEIGRALELSPASVSRIVGRLLRAGVVVEDGHSPGAGGRPATAISFNPRAGAVIAVDLGATTCHGALADLAGDLLYEEIRPTKEQGAAFATLVAVIDSLQAEAAREGVAIAALAVGVPAILDPDTGLGIAGPSVEWEQFDVVRALRDRVATPFVVENDVNLAALAQAWRGDGRQVDDFVTLYLGPGVGGAIVANGRLVKGRHNAGGEIGYLLVDREQLRRAPDHATGGLESLIAASAIAKRYLALAGPEATRAGHGPGELTVVDVFDAAVRGDARAIEVLDELVDHVAMAAIAVASVVDPALVILDGPVGRALEPQLDRIVARLEDCLPTAPRLIVSRLPGNSTLIGAVAAALQLARKRSAPSALFGAFTKS